MNKLLANLITLSLILIGTCSISKGQILIEGSGSFKYIHGKKPITVWYYKPKNLKRDAEIVFVMHGIKRNGQDYRDSWIKHAERYDFLLVVPEFSKNHFKGSRKYNLGNMITRSGKHRDQTKWSFTAIELIFEEVKKSSGLIASKYNLYGHSAGAQFVHRFILFVPNSRVKKAIAANAGWYTMPQDDVNFPYGMRKSAFSKNQLREAFSRDLIILLGSNDNDPNHKYLRKTPEANAQGKHRLERGEMFFRKGKIISDTLSVPFSWRLKKVKGVGHSNSKMSNTAADLIESDY